MTNQTPPPAPVPPPAPQPQQSGSDARHEELRKKVQQANHDSAMAAQIRDHR